MADEEDHVLAPADIEGAEHVTARKENDFQCDRNKLSDSCSETLWSVIERADTPCWSADLNGRSNVATDAIQQATRQEHCASGLAPAHGDASTAAAGLA
eukprot:149448-Pyramimonas_sp.AAC.1